MILSLCAYVHFQMFESVCNPGALLTVFLCVLLGGFRAASAAPYLEALTTARSAAAKIFRTIERVPGIDSSSGSGKKLLWLALLVLESQQLSNSFRGFMTHSQVGTV